MLCERLKSQEPLTKNNYRRLTVWSLPETDKLTFIRLASLQQEALPIRQRFQSAFSLSQVWHKQEVQAPEEEDNAGSDSEDQLRPTKLVGMPRKQRFHQNWTFWIKQRTNKDGEGFRWWKRCFQSLPSGFGKSLVKPRGTSELATVQWRKARVSPPRSAATCLN